MAGARPSTDSSDTKSLESVRTTSPETRLRLEVRLRLETRLRLEAGTRIGRPGVGGRLVLTGVKCLERLPRGEEYS